MNIMATERGLMVPLILTLPRGLHARPSAKLAQIARKFQSDILLRGEEGEVDAKSMLDVLSLSCPARARLVVLAKGPDAKEALTEIYDYLAGPKDWNGKEDS